mgnify:CR=1 FL=1
MGKVEEGKTLKEYHNGILKYKIIYNRTSEKSISLGSGGKKIQQNE